MPETIHIDTSEAYQPTYEYSASRLESSSEFVEKSASFTPGQKYILEIETELLGIPPASQPDKFLAAHNALIDDLDKDVNEQLPIIKREVIERTAAYFERDDESARSALSKLLETRLAATDHIFLTDTLATEDFFAGQFLTNERALELHTGGLIIQLQASPDIDTYRSSVGKIMIAHELMHGMLAAGFQDTNEGRITVRNGLMTWHAENPDSNDMNLHHHALWLSESAIESFRDTLFETNQVHYEPGVMVLHMLDKLLPGLRDRLVLAAINRSGPAPLFGEIEGLLGPTAIEEIEPLINSVADYEDIENFTDKIVAMLPADLQEKGRTIIAEEQKRIFG